MAPAQDQSIKTDHVLPGVPTTEVGTVPHALARAGVDPDRLSATFLTGGL